MDVTISIVETSVNLGQPVTVNYTSTGFLDTQLVADCLSNPIDLGAGDQSGTIKFLPIVNGSFNIEITGYAGDQNSDGEYYQSKSAAASIEVK